jgi:transcriptional regulator with XRE-family HTH domain
LRPKGEVPPQRFGERVAFLRKRWRGPKGQKLSQERLAKAVGLGKNAVYNWEAGNSYPGSLELARVAEFFHVDVEWLFEGEREMLAPTAGPVASHLTVAEAVAAFEVAWENLRAAVARLGELPDRGPGAEG